MEKGVLIGLLLLLVIVNMFSFISANPYSYDDSMDMKYKKVDGKIIYGYGDGIKYETSLRPKGVNWSEWRKSGVEISKRKVVNKTWAEIEEEIKLKENEKSKGVFGNLIKNVGNFFLRLIGREKVPVEEEDF